MLGEGGWIDEIKQTIYLYGLFSVHKYIINGNNLSFSSNRCLTMCTGRTKL